MAALALVPWSAQEQILFVISMSKEQGQAEVRRDTSPK